MIVFDLDGTLYWTAPVTVQAVIDSAAELGLAAPAEQQVLEHMGIGIGDLVRAVFPELSETEIAETRLTVRRRERELIRQQARLYQGIPELLEKLHGQGRKMAICSNGSLEYINAVITATGIAHFFHVLESGSLDPSKGPAIRRLMELPGVGRLVLVGDTPQDRQAAADNDVDFIAAMYGYGHASLGDCRYRAQTVAELDLLLSDWLAHEN